MAHIGEELALRATRRLGCRPSLFESSLLTFLTRNVSSDNIDRVRTAVAVPQAAIHLQHHPPAPLRYGRYFLQDRPLTSDQHSEDVLQRPAIGWFHEAV